MAQPTAMTIEEISARLEIEDLLHRYSRAIDTLELDLLDDVFLPDARLDYTSSGGVAGPYAEVKEWLRAVLSGFLVRQHLVTNREIQVRGDQASCRCYLYNPMGRPGADGAVHLFFLGGSYEDELVRTAAGWRISSRVETQWWADLLPRIDPTPRPA